jgi:hypothetical protein
MARTGKNKDRDYLEGKSSLTEKKLLILDTDQVPVLKALLAAGLALLEICFCNLLGLGASFVFASDAPVRYDGPVEVGLMSQQIREASGLAPSRLSAGILWTHNDSGGEPVLYAVSAVNANLRGQLRFLGVPNIDWEDVSSFEQDNKAWLVAGDVGDNLSRRSQVVLHFVPEPDPAHLDPKKELSLPPSYSIHFVYEDGPRDCESVAVDPKEHTVYLLSKRDPVPHLYRLPLAAASKEHPAVARLVGKVPHLPQPVGWQWLRPTATGAVRGEPTAMGFNNDGTLALVLTYGDLLLFERETDQSWAEVLGQEPHKLPPDHLPQAEGACFSGDGQHVYVVSEGTQRLLRYDRK